MGTNYYHRTNLCGECGRYDQTHIGKLSFGWEFSFQAVYDTEGKLEVGSWRKWRERLERGGEVWNEYGQQTLLTKFITTVNESRLPHNEVNPFIHAVYCQSNTSMDASYLKTLWLDENRWSFSSGKFA